MDLLVDLGGTNTRVALGDSSGVLAQTTRRYENQQFDGLAPLLTAYLDDVRPDGVARLCAGVAGPVQGDQAQLTNHSWLIRADTLRTATGALDVHLLNDLQAQGYALDGLPKECVKTLLPGDPHHPDTPRIVLNLGTGCNMAVVHRAKGRLFVPAGESGHSPLPHAQGELGALFDHLGTLQSHRPVEAALSGPGLTHIHAWSTGETQPPEIILDRADAGEKGPAHSLALFIQTLGMVAGGFALHHLPMGGLFLSGGLARRLAPYLLQDGFPDHFIARGPYTHILRAIPVYVLSDSTFALHGCARYLRQLQG